MPAQPNAFDNSGMQLGRRVDQVIGVADTSGLFREQTLAFAQARMPGLGINRVRCGFDGTGGVSPQAGYGNAPVTKANYSDAWTLNGAGVWVRQKLPIISHPHDEPFMVRVKCRIDATTFTANGQCRPISMSDSAGGGTTGIEMMCLSGAGTTQLSWFIYDTITVNAATSTTISCGPDGVLGSDLCPAFSWFTVSLWFDMQFGHWEFSDVPNPANVFTVVQQDHWPVSPCAIGTANTDPFSYMVEDVAVAYRAAGWAA